MSQKVPGFHLENETFGFETQKFVEFGIFWKSLLRATDFYLNFVAREKRIDLFRLAFVYGETSSGFAGLFDLSAGRKDERREHDYRRSENFTHVVRSNVT